MGLRTGLKESLNGKALPLTFIIAFCIGYGVLQAQVRVNNDNIEDLKPNTQQVARLDERVQGVNKQLTEFKQYTEKNFDKLDNKIDKVLSAVMR